MLSRAGKIKKEKHDEVICNHLHTFFYGVAVVVPLLIIDALPQPHSHVTVAPSIRFSRLKGVAH
jgi:hypothetical protein